MSHAGCFLRSPCPSLSLSRSLAFSVPRFDCVVCFLRSTSVLSPSVSRSAGIVHRLPSSCCPSVERERENDLPASRDECALTEREHSEARAEHSMTIQSPLLPETLCPRSSSSLGQPRPPLRHAYTHTGSERERVKALLLTRTHESRGERARTHAEARERGHKGQDDGCQCSLSLLFTLASASLSQCASSVFPVVTESLTLCLSCARFCLPSDDVSLSRFFFSSFSPPLMLTVRAEERERGRLSLLPLPLFSV